MSLPDILADAQVTQLGEEAGDVDVQMQVDGVASRLLPPTKPSYVTPLLSTACSLQPEALSPSNIYMQFR